MSDEEEENFCFFGKPLDPYDEDAFPKKKPISVEEQIATDAQGRRRFHGAFTGGFSAGFYNTVGSLEGWTPSEFKSTRQEKAKSLVQKPADFMDQEDLSEYGIAPQTIRATKDYSTSKKRRKQVFSDGPIPGIPVLETLFTSGNETIGYLLLRKIGIKDKIKHRDELDPNMRKYGCQKPDSFQIPEKIQNKQYKIPEIYTEHLVSSKSNTFGLDYKGLDRSHVNLFTSSNLIVTDRNNKKFSIAGQAFGVGAFEEDDDDIYVKEDMSNYDFELKKEKSIKKNINVESNLLFGMFKVSRAPLIFKKSYPPPVIPHSFTGKHKVKKSRFEPIEIKTEETEINRNQINPAVRAKYLGEEITKTNQEIEQPKTKSFDISSIMADRFVSASQKESNDILEPVKKTETMHGTKDMREAAGMKMFGALTRISTDWSPCPILCKRFNVPEPLLDLSELKNRKRTKNLIFENQKFAEEENLLLKAGVSLPTTSSTEEILISETDKETILNENIIKTEKSEETENNEIPTKDITERIGIAEKEKVDLFKAVFLSSSESESEEEEVSNKDEKESDEKIAEFKETILLDLVPKIRPLKQGILSNITFQSKNKKVEEDIKTEEDTKTEDNSSDKPSLETKIVSYGPQLPVQKVIGNSSNEINCIDIDEWVEKDSKNKRKKSKHKKDKKKKHKHSKRDKNK